MNMNYSERLAAFIAEKLPEHIPPEVIEKSKWSIIDGLAVTLGGYSQIGRQIVAFIDDLGGKPVATIVGAGMKTAAPMAAYANGTLSHVLDYDDLNESMGGHPTGPVLAAILAVGEMVKASGEQLLLAYALGVETETKIGRPLIKSLYQLGWHPTAVLGTIGAAAGCCKLLGLDAEKTLMALGIAGSGAGGLKQNFGTLTKSLHVGQAAKNGVMAALLAQSGWTADRQILEGPFGFCILFCGPGKYDLKDMPASLGNPWEIASPGIKLKKYPCCGSIHPALDALFELLGDIDLRSDQIKKIECFLHPSKDHILVHPRPRTGLEAKFSLEYCMAAGFLDGKVCLDQFTDAQVGRQPIKKLLSRIYANKDETVPEWGSIVRIETTEGQILTHSCETFPRIENWNNLRDKFMDCAVPALSSSCAEATLAKMQHFEEISNISSLMQTLSGDK